MAIWQDSKGNLHDDDNGKSLSNPLWPKGMTELTDNQVMSLLTPPVNELWEIYKETAKSALNKSDTTIIRCSEKSITVPVEWVNYRESLRSIIAATTGDPTVPLPLKPAFPAGT